MATIRIQNIYFSMVGGSSMPAGTVSHAIMLARQRHKQMVLTLVQSKDLQLGNQLLFTKMY